MPDWLADDDESVAEIQQQEARTVAPSLPPGVLVAPPDGEPNTIPPEIFAELYDAEVWRSPEREDAFRDAFQYHLTQTTDRAAAAWRAIVTCRKLFKDWTPKTAPGPEHVSAPLSELMQRLQARLEADRAN